MTNKNIVATASSTKKKEKSQHRVDPMAATLPTATMLPGHRLMFLLAGIFAISISALALEITFTRIFSVILWYHFVFIVISMAIFGLGLGGLISHFWQRRGNGLDLVKNLPVFAILFSLSVPATVWMIYRFPYPNLWFGYLVITIIPFILVGTTMSALFMHFGHLSGKLYFADLIAAGIGSLAVFFSMERWGVSVTLLVVTVMGWFAAVMLGFALNRRRLAVVAVLILGLFLLFLPALSGSRAFTKNFAENPELKYNVSKTLYGFIQTQKGKAEVVFSKWNAMARTDVVKITDGDQMWIFTDGGAGSSMYRFDGDLEKVSFLKSDNAYMPFTWGPKDDILIIGPGGGKDVLIAMLGGAKQVTAVEINSGVIDAVKRFDEFNGHIYHRPDINLIHGDGRSFVRRTNEKYDMIYLPLVFTQAAEGVGYSLVENYVFTLEAFRDYLDHLNPGGKLVLKLHDQADLMKALTTGAKALMERGETLGRAMRHMVAVSGATGGPGVHENHKVMFPVLIVQKEMLTEQEGAKVMDNALALRQPVLFVPYYWEKGVMASMVGNLLELDRLIRITPVNIAPATDNRPFFYNTAKLLPGALVGLLGMVILMVIILTLVLSPSLRGGGHTLLEAGRGKKTSNPISWIYFASLGLGFIMIEISLIQESILFLGQPTWAAALVIFSLLIFGGIGSFITSTWDIGKQKQFLPRLLLGVTITSLAYGLFLPLLFDKFLGESFVARSLLAVAFMAPLGLLVGMPFPVGLRLLREASPSSIPAMWGINGAFSVLGSVLAVVVAMLAGFNWSLVMGALAYGLIYAKTRAFAA